MEKILRLLYYYSLGIFIFFVTYMVTVMFFSPRQDALERGFIPCTKQLISSIADCNRGSISCPMKYLWKDMKCNSIVILDGLGAWVKGEQSTPWESYLFTPVTEIETDGIAPYEELDDMQELESQRAFIEKKQKELDEAKNRQLNLKDSVLLSNPDIDLENTEEFIEDEIINLETGNIDDEAYMGNIEVQEHDEKEEKKSAEE